MFSYSLQSSVRLLKNRHVALQPSLLLVGDKPTTKRLFTLLPKHHHQAQQRFMQHHNTRKVDPSSSPLICNSSHRSSIITSVASKRHLHLPHLPQFPKKIPNKYELLIRARGFLQRLKVRIKYPLMKQMRPFTLNDISALFSWVFLGHTVWLLVGTTSFLSLGLWAANSLQFQGNNVMFCAVHRICGINPVVSYVHRMGCA